MSKFSDHTKPQVDINQYLPEVYRSDVNKSVFQNAFNRLFTKDDTNRVAGFVGEGNPQALRNRQIVEETPHRQAYQLAPTMYTKVGTVENALSFSAFSQQLELMGVDMDRFAKWGDTVQFNWVPPINIDMIVNYADYFWSPANAKSAPQYITIENRCNKAQSKIRAYRNIMRMRGSSFEVIGIDFINNAFTIQFKNDDLFVDGFVFSTKEASNANINNRFWTVATSSFDTDTNKTTITVVEPIITTSAAAPVDPSVGNWWFDTSYNTIKTWNGATWVVTSAAITANISLDDLATVYQSEANCICNQDIGWDMGPWDDNQLGIVVWNTALIACISHASEAGWIAANNNTSCHTNAVGAPQPAPAANDLWYDVTNDVLKQRSAGNDAWHVVVRNFSTVLAVTTGTHRWDLSTECAAQSSTQWTEQNEWIHKSEVQSFTGIKRAIMPIIEYASTIEMNEWVQDTLSWKYRTEYGSQFTATTHEPHRFELEPIFSFVTVNVGGKWVIYLFDSTLTTDCNIDYTNTFVPGYQFRIMDDGILSDVYTVATSEYREPRTTDPVVVQGTYMMTIVTISDTLYSSPLVGGGANNVRIVPQQTSLGDVWRGYHAHWLVDDTSVNTKPVAAQSTTIFSRDDAVSVTLTPVAVPQGVLVTGDSFQELTIQGNNVTSVELLSKFKYSPTAAHLFATPNSGALRVYVNGIRQYGTYTETVATAIPPLTVIGYSVWDSQRIEYVNGITFLSPLKNNDVVRIEVGPAAQSDLGNGCVPIRTIEDEAEFTQACALGTQPAYSSLIKYRRAEQIKSTVNQYPVFNVYNVITGEVVKATNTFGFAEDPSYPINTSIQRRIIVSSDGKEFTFSQSLQDTSNGLLYGYRNISELTLSDGITPRQWWYNPYTNKMQGWDGLAWTTAPIFEGSSDSRIACRIVVRATEPTEFENVEGTLWYNQNNNVLYQRNVVAGTWVTLHTDTIVGGDPSLTTIWKCGKNNERSVPAYVDSARQPTTIGSPSGSWQVPNQWFYNPEHKNRDVIRLSDLVTHFTTILQQQSSLPGFLGGGRFILTHDSYNYGLGGTIREHNDGFDTLISAVNVSSTTPVGVIEFAQKEYASSIQFINELFDKHIVEALSAYDLASITQFEQYVINQVLSKYQSNEFMSQVFSDTSAYDATTGMGVKNWISTTPMFGLSRKMVPYVLQLGNNTEIVHHDGHRSTVTFSVAEQDYLSRLIVNRADARTSSGKRGVISALTPPSSVAQMALEFNATAVDPHDALIPGVYWYRVGGGSRSLYRFQCYSIGDGAPASYDVNGELPDGTMYYNTSTETVYAKSGATWVAVTAPGSHDVSPLWVVVDFQRMLANTIYEIEQRLYAVSPDYVSLTFDYDSLIVDAQDQATYDQLYKERFSSYVNELNISTPLVNTNYSPTNAFTWNYSDCVVTTQPQLNGSRQSAGCWQQLYTNLYGTPYPHLEPWCLQGYTTKPDWWDAQYLNTVPGGRKWNYNHATATGMWENIRIGKIPAGRAYPNGRVSTGNASADGVTVPTYSYFSVNISDSTIPGGYAPDSILPPYYDISTIESTLPTVRSVFISFSGEITSPSADYEFGKGGPVEWRWMTSVQHVYDKLVIAFLMQPVRFMHATFGPTYTNVGGLQVETTFEKVYAHDIALFHGDLYNTNQSYNVRGLNQWYVNQNRYTGFDTNTQFRQEWAGWTPRLTYQFGGIIDTSSFDISTKYFDINKQDFSVALVNNGVVGDAWVDAFNVSLLSMPPAIIQYNNQGAWKFELDTLAAIPRTIHYYGVKSYVSEVAVGSDEIRVLRYRPTTIQAASKRFYVVGDHTSVFAPNRQFAVSGSSYNDRTYTVASVLYESSNDRTRIVVAETVPSNAVDGYMDVLNVDAGWDTGDMVVLSSSNTMAAPLQPDVPYYVIKVGLNHYKLAETFTDATEGVTVSVVSGGTGVLTASAIKSSFRTFGGAGVSNNIWYHYELDTNVVRELLPPTTIQGFQTLINVIDGYVEYQQQYNLKYGVTDTSDFDPATGRVVDWQLETERCIEWAHGLRRSMINISDRYQVSANVTDNTFTFTDSQPMWTNGTRIAFTSSGSLPAPLIANAPYYVVSTDVEGTFKVSISANALDESMIIDLTSVGSGSYYAGLYDRTSSFPSFELNPIRNNVWIETPVGVLADVIQGPYTDIRVQQTIFDQYSRPIPSDKLTVYREDGRSNIAMRASVPNDVNPTLTDAYNNIHIGGGHLFIEGYEHFLLFNNYTTSGDLIYDAFLGLNAKKFNLDYAEKADYSLRPTLGGFYMSGGEFKRNIEGSITDMRNFYDATGMNEATDMARHAHSLIGYRGPSDYLNLLNVNSKSQFAFYRGMLQTKGSVNSINAYINSRRFIDAKMDEFWAWKIAEFGDSRPRIYPEIKLLATDGVKDDVRLLFNSAYETASSTSFENEIHKGFQPVSFASPDRWVDFPEQRDIITSPLFLDAEITSMDVVYIHELKPTADEIQEIGMTHWYNGVRLHKLVGNNWVTDTRVSVSEHYTYWKHTGIADTVRVVRRTFASNPTFLSIVETNSTARTVTLAGDNHLDFDIGAQFKILGSAAADGIYTVSAVEYTATSTLITVIEPIAAGTTGSAYVERRVFGNMSALNLNEGLGVDEYIRVNAEMIRFVNGGFNNVITIFTLNPAKNRISPAKLVDKKAHAVIHDMPLWHPAIGYHYPNAQHNIDKMDSTDPAKYSYTRNPTNVSERPWNMTEVGTVWMDTSHLGYVPYYDDVVFPNVNDRLYAWGNLAEWASVKVYEWVSTTTAPSAWERQAAADANDPTKPQNKKATGSARKSVFVRRRASADATANANATITTSLVVATGDLVLFTAVESLPSALSDSTKYIVGPVTTVGSVLTFPLIDADTRQLVTFTNDGVGALTIIPAFKSTDWKLAPMYRQRMFGATDIGAVGALAVDEPTIILSSEWAVGDVVQVYINGILKTTGAVKLTGGANTIDLADTGIIIRERDIVDMVRPEHVVTDDESSFDPDSDDDGTVMVQWVEDYQYTTHVEMTGNTTSGITSTTYYSYWVESTTTRDPNDQSGMSAADVANTLVNIPVPHFVVQMPLDDTTWVEKYGYGVIQFGSTFSMSDVTEAYHITPVMYREAIIRNAASYITDDDRFVIRFLRDVALRDDMKPNEFYAAPKNKHEQWFLFRREQSSTVPRELWVRLMESIMGQKYDDATVRVPSLERELYDVTYGTDTRYGLGDSQTFVDKKLALATVIEYLQRPTNNFYPADIDDFFNRNDFSTPAGIKIAMDEIYNTFPATHVNNIWFDALLDALSTRSKYKEIMKTSWIALHGIRVLEVGGLFDD